MLKEQIQTIFELVEYCTDEIRDQIENIVKDRIPIGVEDLVDCLKVRSREIIKKSEQVLRQIYESHKETTSGSSTQTLSYGIQQEKIFTSACQNIDYALSCVKLMLEAGSRFDLSCRASFGAHSANSVKCCRHGGW